MGVPSGQTGSAWPPPRPGDSLTYEVKNLGNVEEEEALDEWIEVMEKVLPLSLMATKGGIESLISLCSTLIEEQKKRTQSRFREPLGGPGGDGLDAVSGKEVSGGSAGSALPPYHTGSRRQRRKPGCRAGVCDHAGHKAVLSCTAQVDLSEDLGSILSCL